MSDKKMKKRHRCNRSIKPLPKPGNPGGRSCSTALKGLSGGRRDLSLGQGVQDFIWNFDFTEKTAGDPTVAVMVMLSVILTVAGVYDHIAQWAGAVRQCLIRDLPIQLRFGHGAQDRGFVLGGWRSNVQTGRVRDCLRVFAAFIIGLIKTGIAMLGGS